MSRKKTAPTNFRKVIDQLSHRHQTYTVFSAFVRLSACALSAQTREAEYLEESKHWKPDELSEFAHAMACLTMEMDDRPFEDLLGGYYMEYALSTKSQQGGGEFHTPKPVCDLMARMTFPEGLPPGNEKFTVCEPACGAGAIILSVGEIVKEQRHRLRVTAIDINKTACDMCFINTTLWGIPTRVIHGNTIANEFWSQWFNFHWLCPWLGFNRTPTEPQPVELRPMPEQGAPPSPNEIEQLTMAFA